MASKKITGMTEALGLEDTDLLTGVDLSAPADSDKNVKIAKSALGFAADDDPRLSDSRAPTSHAASHEDGGSDELALAAAQITDFQTTVSQNPTLVTVDAQKHTHSNKGALDKVRDDLAGDAWLDNSGAYSVPSGGVPANAALNGYTELGTNLGAPAATATIPVDGKLYEFNAALTVDLVITVGTKPTAPTCASSVIYVKPGGRTVTFSGVDYWAGGEMPTIGTVMRYVISTTVTGDVLADGEAFEALP